MPPETSVLGAGEPEGARSGAYLSLALTRVNTRVEDIPPAQVLGDLSVGEISPYITYLYYLHTKAKAKTKANSAKSFSGEITPTGTSIHDQPIHQNTGTDFTVPKPGDPWVSSVHIAMVLTP